MLDAVVFAGWPYPKGISRLRERAIDALHDDYDMAQASVYRKDGIFIV